MLLVTCLILVLAVVVMSKKRTKKHPAPQHEPTLIEGQLSVPRGQDSVTIDLPHALPKVVFVAFEDLSQVPCDPHHHQHHEDTLTWRLETRHGRTVLSLEWNVHSHSRVIQWAVET